MSLDRRAAGLFVLAAGLVWGCGGDGKQPLAPLVGTVHYKGQPVVGAHLSFLPDDKTLRPAVAKTDEQGRFRFETYEPRDGAAVGPGKIAISLRGPNKPLKSVPGLGEAALEHLSEVGDPLIPLKYFDPEKSGITVEVKRGRENRLDIVLTD